MRLTGVIAAAFASASFFFAAPMGVAYSCSTQTPCVIGDGHYLIQTPDGWDGESSLGAIVYFHGWQGSAAGVMRNGALRKVASDAGVALVAVNGKNKTWSYPSSPSQHRDELQFLDDLFADLERRFPIDMGQVMASGFSMGGSMTWYAACYRGERFAGIAPVAGAFWEPLPDDCPSNVPHVFHIHGTADTVVPIEGRPIGTQFHQGDLYESLTRFSEVKNWQSIEAQTVEEGVLLECRREKSRDETFIEVCLHDGGHSIRAEWVGRAWKELSAIKGWQVN